MAGKPVRTMAIKKVVKNFEAKNGNRLADFTIKEMVLLFHEEMKEEIRKCYNINSGINEKLDTHIEWGQSKDRKVNKILGEHDKIMQHISDVLPEKGFCEKVNNALWPEEPDIPLDQKVEIVWHDRRWIKYLLIGTLSIVGVDTIMSIIM